MCQLLGLNSNLPTDVCFDFTGFKARGGVTDQHADGWGIAFFEAAGVHLIRQPAASGRCPRAAQVARTPRCATHIVAHIRKATVGEVCLANTHPFQRRLWGRTWVFAHNGTLRNFRPRLGGRFVPGGATDSEAAFCWLMQEADRHFGPTAPATAALLDWLAEAVIALSRFGVANFLLSDGHLMLAHSSTRLHQVSRRGTGGPVHLLDADLRLERTAAPPAQRSVILATAPLTRDEAWTALPPGSLWCFHRGETVACRKTVPGRSELAAPVPA